MTLPRFPSFLSFAKVMQCMEYSKIWLNLIFAAQNLIFMGSERFPSVSCRSSNYHVTLRLRSTFQNLESTLWLAKLWKECCTRFYGHQLTRSMLTRSGVLLGILGGGVLPGSPNPDPTSDQKMSFSTPIFRPSIYNPYLFSDLEEVTKRNLVMFTKTEIMSFMHYWDKNTNKRIS